MKLAAFVFMVFGASVVANSSFAVEEIFIQAWLNVGEDCVPKVKVVHDDTGIPEGLTFNYTDWMTRWNSSKFKFMEDPDPSSGTVNIVWTSDQLPSHYYIAGSATLESSGGRGSRKLTFVDDNGHYTQVHFTYPDEVKIRLRNTPGYAWEEVDGGPCDNDILNIVWTTLHELGHAMLAVGHPSGGYPQASEYAVMSHQSDQSDAYWFDYTTTPTVSDLSLRDDLYIYAGDCSNDGPEDDCFCYYGNPIAHLTKAEYSHSGEFACEVVGEEKTKAFRIQCQLENGNWLNIDELEKSNLGRYQFDLGSQTGKRIRLLEVDLEGNMAVLWSGGPGGGISTENNSIYEPDFLGVKEELAVFFRGEWKRERQF